MRLAPLLMLFALPLLAQETPHQIDRTHAACMEKAITTLGMTECSRTARGEWDAELNKNYRELSALLKPAARLTLRAAQVEWTRFRDAELKSIGAIYGSLQGTMYVPVRAESAMKVVRARAIQLGEYVEALRQKAY